ncbi:fatty acid desaturase [Thalassolituus sp.]|uniref:fatty acid desaturase n=1 Tax=Thalassolituus sp. TaxID=2030822 RepID=UPI002A82CDB4|nr:fatty acid desaturase [Thalassolituus sp.]
MTSTTSTDAERIETIKAVIRESGDNWRRRHSILANQNFMGMTIFLGSIAGILLCGWAYLDGYLSAWLCIPLVAILTSFLHELEHDLIHWMYFKNNKKIHNLMLLGVWIFRPGTINPWIRRKLHFVHHKTSGTSQDLEERGIGNGHPYGFVRFWVMMDTFTGNLLRVWMFVPAGRRWHSAKRIIASNLPFGVITAIVWYSFLAIHLINGLLSLASWSVPSALLNYANAVTPLIVILIAPFYLRSFCLNFISSNMHYYGNVESVLTQTQVLNAKRFLPFQLFCFNFGSTHGIHHFVVGEPFYIRQLTASDAHKVMGENGVPFNDLGTFVRANRYEDVAPNQASTTPA